MTGVAQNVVQTHHIDQVWLADQSQAPLALALPELDTVESLLSFANTRVAYIGRLSELDELKSFLSTDKAFSWWVWTGPAGIGKSRLAVELCRIASASNWHAGFLREADQARLGSSRFRRPTLAVIDYAAQRSDWLADALAMLSQGSQETPIRVLVLERDTSGDWWSTTQRVNHMEEAYRVTSSMYAMPHLLHGLDRADGRALVRATATQLGQPTCTSTQVEEVIDLSEHMDSQLRPLFVQVATVDRLDETDGHVGRDDALRRIVARASAHLDALISDPSLAALARNLRFFATTVRGMTVEDYANLSHNSEVLAGLLPEIFQPLGPSLTVDDLIDGLRPDIVGDLYTEALANCDPASANYGKILNNRGVTSLALGSAR
jgi:hypothetical protein